MRQAIDNPKAMARIIKKRREELGISQKDLASLCNLSHNGISKMETNESEIKLSTLLKMSKILGIKLILEMEE
jgi:transcriptional regulator with XRE-family HTH domain